MFETKPLKKPNHEEALIQSTAGDQYPAGVQYETWALASHPTRVQYSMGKASCGRARAQVCWAGSLAGAQTETDAILTCVNLEQ